MLCDHRWGEGTERRDGLQLSSLYRLSDGPRATLEGECHLEEVSKRSCDPIKKQKALGHMMAYVMSYAMSYVMSYAMTYVRLYE